MFLGPQAHSRGSNFFENFSADLWKSQDVPHVLQKCHFMAQKILPDLHGVSFEGVDEFGRGHVEDGDDAVDGAAGNVLSIRGLELR